MARFFSYFRIISHHPSLLVCDDNVNIKMAARNAFPTVKIQTCTNHFKENIRRELKVRTDKTYLHFPSVVKTILSRKLSDIKCFNSHLQDRLTALKVFESFKHATLWLNAYVLKRRFTELSGCEGKFRHLNGKKAIDLTKKQHIVLPTFFQSSTVIFVTVLTCWRTSMQLEHTG